MTCVEGLHVSDPERLKALDNEKAGLKKFVVGLSFGGAMLKDVGSRKW